MCGTFQYTTVQPKANASVCVRNITQVKSISLLFTRTRQLFTVKCLLDLLTKIQYNKVSMYGMLVHQISQATY